MKTLRVITTYLLSLCFVSFIVGCVPEGGADSGRQGRVFDNTTPKLSIFLTASNGKATAVQMHLAGVEISDGVSWHPLLDAAVELDSTEVLNQQIFVSRVSLQPGTYSKIRYTVDQAALKAERSMPLSIVSEPVEYDLARPLVLKERGSSSLFLYWDVDHSVSGLRFSPAIGAAPQSIPITAELAYVSCPDIDTIYIIRTDSNTVTGSWGVSGHPSYMQTFTEQDELYVLADDESAIKIIKLSSGRVKDVIYVPLQLTPSFMVMDDSADNAYLLDSDGYVTRVDISSGIIAKRLRIGQGEQLQFAAYLGSQQRLAVTSAWSHDIFLLDSETLQKFDTITASSAPLGLLAHNDNLYIAESSANTVMIYNFNTGSSSRSSVGLQPVRFLEHDDHIYVSNYRSGSISILLPEQLTVLKEIRIGGTPQEMASSAGRNWLYVNDPKSQGLAVVDLTSHTLATRIDLKAKPLDIVSP